jgi:protocatechuate 3,4-dioxygenase beta subunit
MTTTLTLPSVRNLAPYGYNETCDMADETYLREIEDAICAGRVLDTVASSKDRRETPRQEVSVTCFRDPRAGEIRYAVEIWNGGRNGRYDYADRKTAGEEAEQWVRSISIQPTGR